MIFPCPTRRMLSSGHSLGPFYTNGLDCMTTAGSSFSILNPSAGAPIGRPDLSPQFCRHQAGTTSSTT